MKSYFRWIVAMALLLFCAVGAIAQTSNGTIAGVVTDSTGAAIVNAKVTSTSVQTGEVRTIVTNSVGAYRFESVLPGLYILGATADSFASARLVDVHVVASTITSLNVQLKPGKTTETVEVSAQAEMLQTESGEISSTISTSEVQSLPISSLSPYALAATLPGVVTGAATSMGNGQTFSVNGNRSRANNFLIEGQDNNDAGIHGQGLQPSNLDAVQEVSIQTNSYGAEFGHGGGSVSNLIYKSGTNNFHGSLWNLHSNSALDATDHSYTRQNYSKDTYHENTFGWSFGGPVQKDKLFFFSSMQWDKYRSTSSGSTLWAPTVAGAATLQQISASSTQPFQKQQIATLLQAFGNIRGVNNTNWIKIAPDPFNLNAARPDVQYGSTIRTGIPYNSDSTELDLKGDYLVTQNDTLNLRYIRTDGNTPYDLYNWAGQLPGFDAMQGGAAHNAGITYTHVFSPRIVNEMRLSYGRIGFTFDWRPDTFSNPLVDNGNLPGVCISTISCWGPPSGGPQGRFHNTYQYQDSLSWTTGTHTFKFGGDIADIRVADQVPVNWYGSINYVDTFLGSGASKQLTGTGLANYIDEMSGSGSVQKTFGSRFVHAPLMSQNYFVQDTWKLRANLTLTYGLRYELNAAAANNMPYPAVDPANPFPTDYPVVVKQKLDTGNWGPRFGLAYTPHFWSKLFGQDKTVIRAGAGIFYDGIFTNILDNNQSGAPNTVPATVSFPVNASNPRGSANFNWAAISPMLNPVINDFASVTSIPSNLKNPRTYQWNFNVQRELPSAFSAQIGYVGTRGTKLYGQDQLNPQDPELYGYTCGGIYCRLNTDRGSVLLRDNSGDSYYHALQADLNRRMTKGLMLRAAYTWSKTIDTGSEIFTTGNYSSYPVVQGVPHGVYDRGLAAQDRRQRFSLSYVYEIPEIRGFAKFNENPVYSFFGKVVNGWQLAGTTVFQSGAPGNVFLGYDWNWDGYSNDRPMLGNPSAPATSWGVMEGSQICEGVAWWYSSDPCHPVTADSVHWIAAPFLTQADKPVARNSYTTPGRQDWTFSITKQIKIGERQKFEWRTEFFNPFNHANTGVPNLTLVGGVIKSQFYNPNNPSPNLLGDFSETTTGGRTIRMWLKYSF